MTKQEARADMALMQARDRYNAHQCKACEEDRFCQALHNLSDKMRAAHITLRTTRDTTKV